MFSGEMVRGGQIHIRNVVEGLRERGHEVHIVDWKELSERTYQHSVSPMMRYGVDPLRTAVRSVSVGWKTDTDIIISKTRKTYIPGLLAARALGVPHVVHVGSSLSATDQSKLTDMISVTLRLQAPHDAYFVVGTNIAAELRERGVPEKAIYNVSNAINVERFCPDRPVKSDIVETRIHDRSGPLVGFVGGLHEYKGVIDLAEATERSERDFTVVFAGDGPERERLRKRLGDRAVFLGAVPYDEMPALYHALDIFVLPSHTEGIPRTILEAQAAGTPVIATHVGGVPDIVTDGESGLLCDPRSPDVFAARIEEILSDSQLYEHLVEGGRRRVVDSLSWPEMYERYERYLGRILAEESTDE